MDGRVFVVPVPQEYAVSLPPLVEPAAELTIDEVRRYSRHLIIPDVGMDGQKRLKNARVLVIGAGGLGSPALLYLAAAGIGTLGIVDDDVVTLSNLQRQVIHATGDVGRLKTDSARDALGRVNPHVAVETHALRLGPGNAEALIGAYDLVLDGSDNFTTRYLVSDAAFRARRPLVMGWLGIMDAALTTLRPFERGQDGVPNPTYRCLFPEAPPPGTVPTCAEAGVLGALAGMVGSMMALEAVREIVGFGEGLVGRLVLIDARSWRFETLSYGWDPANPLTGEDAAATMLSGAR
jgi:adenylyltransferase/sulfurtransferase